MATRAIISYDGTINDHDALMLGRLLAEAGLTLELAYVRHATEPHWGDEVLQGHEAERLLEIGARALGDLDVERRVVFNGSTAEGLRALAQDEGAGMLVFGSDYRTPAGHVSLQHSAQRLLEGGPVAIALAPADYSNDAGSRFGRIGLLASAGDDDALATVEAFADALGARVTRDEPCVDLLVVGSRPEAPIGRVMISSQAHNAIEGASCPVLVLPRGARIRFDVPVGA
jgi:nucleotide-binding universal stress UspA family protein